MLDFQKLAKPYQVVVPVLNKTFLYHKKTYHVNADDGWWEVTITGNKAKTSNHPMFPLGREIPNAVLGYTCNNSIIFQNFDVARRKWKLGTAAPLYFNQAQTFEGVLAVVWEDGRCYYVEPNYSDMKAPELKDILENNGTLESTKGVTPELRTVFIFHALEKEQLRKLEEMSRLKQAQEEILKTIPGRLKHTFERAGANFVGYSMTGTRIIAEWTINDSSYRYNTVLDSRTWMVVEAGYCMSGDDKRHNITSLVKTAQEYEDRRVTYITRREEEYEDD